MSTDTTFEKGDKQSASSCAAKQENAKSAAERAFEFIKDQHAIGRNVIISTVTSATRYKPKHADLFFIGKDGGLYVRHGKSTHCLAYSHTLLVGITGEGRH